ncbi:MBD domain-containing protein [Cephalotus follicularis]|uniref:MBD domain-containing protein n=1 Tax=Cephalotus follicularis TaxID=3775 RepID=A0A1Q3BLP0_CEPFO|nr:MBD domain-containing protein [Cephalotus follicularis]
MAERNSPDGLPVGWSEQFKVLKSGRQIKSYVDPLTGRRFYSKPEVFRYLKSVKRKKCAKKTILNRQSARKVVVEKSTEDDLPPGWIKELRIKKIANRIRRDPYYTDPSSGYVFRSKKDVLLYLETGEISRHAFKPKKKDLNDLDLTNDTTLPSSAAKWQELEHPATRQRIVAAAGKGNSKANSSVLPETGASNKRQSMEAAVETMLKPAEGISPDKHSMENVTEKGVEILPKAEDFKKDLGKRDSVDLPGSTYAADNLQHKTLIESKLEKSSTEKTYEYSKKLNNKKEFTLPRRFSKRLADLYQKKNFLESKQQKSYNRQTQDYSIKSEDTEFALPFRSSKRLAGLEPDRVPNTLSSKQASQGATTKSIKSCMSEASLQIKTENVMEHADCASAGTNIPSHKAPLNTSKNSLEDSAVPVDQPQKQETKKLSESEPQLVFQFDGSPTVEHTVGHISQYMPVSTPAADILQERGFSNGRTEKYSNRETWVPLIKSKNKKGLHLSKRLAGLELAGHTSADTEIPSNGVLSNTGNKPPEIAAVPIDQPQNMETKKIDELSEPQIVFPFGGSCLDPCLEFAFKTLTGEIPLGDASEYIPVTTPAADILQDKSLLEGGTERSRNRKAQNNWGKSKNKKEQPLRCRSSKRLAGLQPEMGTDTMFSEQVCDIATVFSGKSEATPDVCLAVDGLTIGASQQTEAGLKSGSVSHDFTEVNPLVDPSSMSENHFGQTVSVEQARKLETERMNGEKLNPPLFSPFGDYWSDPCLEFAFKTLTDAIPLEDNLGIQGYFQQQINPSYAQRDASLPLSDFGMPSSFKSNLSSHFDSPDKQAASRQQLPPGNLSFPSCSSISFQQP